MFSVGFSCPSLKTRFKAYINKLSLQVYSVLIQCCGCFFDKRQKRTSEPGPDNKWVGDGDMEANACVSDEV